MNARVRTLVAASLVFSAGCSAGTSDDAISEVPDSIASSAPITVAPSSTITTEVTVTTVPDEGGRDEACIVVVVAGDSLGQIATRVEGVGLDELRAENRLGDGAVIHPGDELDVCIGNDVDDITGASRLAAAPAVIRRQQAKLNELIAPYRLIQLVVDGDSGPLTRQALCAARLGLGLPASGGHMPADSTDEQALLAADGFNVPTGAATWANKWMLLDKTCQVIFIGEGDKLVNIYPTSTGEPGYETRDGQAFEAFRYDPALDTNGWHDSTNFPVAIDNPLNGNMYKPIYFNDGQAIHGANYVPPEPRSKGCARTFPLHQDELIAWLGIGDLTEPTWRKSDLGVVVTVQGQFRPID